METDPDALEDNLAALRAIVEPCRMRLLGLLLSRPMTIEELVASLELSPATVSHHVRILLEASLVRQDSESRGTLYSAQVARVQEIARSLVAGGSSANVKPGADEGDGDFSGDYEGKVLRAFLKDGRLVAIPAQEKKKDVLLRYLVDRCFLEERDYTEREVNQLLGAYHEDVASLRRYMVVGGLLARRAGVYRRVPRAAAPEAEA